MCCPCRATFHTCVMQHGMHNLNIQVGEAFKFVTDQNLDTMKKNLRSVYRGERLNAIWRTWMVKNTILPCYWSKVVNCAGLLLRWQWGYSGWFAGHPCWHQKIVTQKHPICSNHQWGTQYTEHAGVMQGQTHGQGCVHQLIRWPGSGANQTVQKSTAPLSQSTTFIQFPPGPIHRKCDTQQWFLSSMCFVLR